MRRAESARSAPCLLAARGEREGPVHQAMEVAHLLLGAAHRQVGLQFRQVVGVALVGDGQGPAVLLEEGHREPADPGGREAQGVQRRLKLRVGHHVGFRLPKLRSARGVRAGGPAPPREAIPERHGDAEREAAALGRIPVEPEHPAVAQEAAAGDGRLRGNEEVEVGVQEVVLAADADADERHAEHRPHAAVEVGVLAGRRTPRRRPARRRPTAPSRS